MSELELLLLLDDNKHGETRGRKKRNGNVSHLDRQADAQR